MSGILRNTRPLCYHPLLIMKLEKCNFHDTPEEYQLVDSLGKSRTHFRATTMQFISPQSHVRSKLSNYGNGLKFSLYEWCFFFSLFRKGIKGQLTRESAFYRNPKI